MEPSTDKQQRQGRAGNWVNRLHVLKEALGLFFFGFFKKGTPNCIEFHKLPCYDVVIKLISEPSVSFAGLIESKLGNDEANPCWDGFAFPIHGDQNNNTSLFSFLILRNAFKREAS